MLINPSQPELQTALFIIILGVSILVTLKLVKNESFFGKELTNQLKGLAILAIVLSHIGYFLSSNTQFLFPISVLAGVGVNLFLFLSGFGLTVSAISRELTPAKFYTRRLSKLYLPLWIILAILFLADFFLLHKSYPPATVIANFFGFFREANLYIDIDSPLWYFTLIIFYYLLFPWIFHKKLFLLSPLILLMITYILFNLPLQVSPGVLGLYKLHSLAFPIGMAVAILLRSQRVTVPLKNMLAHYQSRKFTSLLFRVISSLILLSIVCYTALNSGVGHGPRAEQFYSLITTGSIILFFITSRLQTKVFEVLGNFSYEIYLFHWPLLYRYDFLYTRMPAYLATALYFLVFVGLAYLLQEMVKRISTSKLLNF